MTLVPEDLKTVYQGCW